MQGSGLRHGRGPHSADHLIVCSLLSPTVASSSTLGSLAFATLLHWAVLFLKPEQHPWLGLLSTDSWAPASGIDPPGSSENQETVSPTGWGHSCGDFTLRRADEQCHTQHIDGRQ